MSEKIKIEWDIINEQIRGICKEVYDGGVKYKSVVGIQRGGLNLSLPVSEYIGVKHRSIKVSFYNGEKLRDEPIVDLFDLDMDERPFIFCDDLIDSGKTLKYIIDTYKLVRGVDYHIAVIHWNKKNDSGLTPDFYGSEKPNGWIVYPWDNDE
jgi:hypoxanthine phosphoribosyltransferase